ncbi:MAG: Lrp/AsnC family transcriptional regulator [Acidobacteria bacterium]|nr:Lrp/AsnC family transcriptional regulator [Acidobacteriota bacterium]
MSKPLLDDDLSRKIVAALQAEGRLSHAELAERLGVSRPTLLDRVRRLEAEGVISGYAALVSPEAVGKPCVAFVAVRLRATLDLASEQRFWKALEAEPDVLEAHSVAGEDCLLLKVVAETPRGLGERLRRICALGPQVGTRTTVVLQTHFQKPGPSPFVAPEGPRKGGKR